MSIFRRKSPERAAQAQADAISEFWIWWQAEGSAQAATAVADRNPESLVSRLTSKVTAMHPDLAWEVAKGIESDHVLVVSAEGNPQLRGLARRWRRAAPDADPTWSFADARPPVADPEGTVLTVAGVDITLRQASAGARVTGARVDVAVHHPAFAHLPEDARQLATFLLLDSVLGEAAVETWIGTIESTTQPSLDAVPLVGLRATVRDLSAQFTDEEGNPHWAVLEGATPDGGRVLASVQIPLRSAIAPDLDTHVGVLVPFTDQTHEGLPGPGSLGPLRALEEHLAGRLGRSGRIVAHSTTGGARILHIYIDGTTPAADQLRAAIGGWDQGEIRMEVAPDPGWELVSHLSV